jgi:hypothetical protein
VTLSRRDTLQWMMAAAALPLPSWLTPASASGPEVAPPFDRIADWPTAIAPARPAEGYGRDPALMEPIIPWPLTFSKAQRATIDLLGDLILPPTRKVAGRRPAGGRGLYRRMDQRALPGPAGGQGIGAQRAGLARCAKPGPAQCGRVRRDHTPTARRIARCAYCQRRRPPGWRSRSRSWTGSATFSCSASTAYPRAKRTWASSAISRRQATIPGRRPRRLAHLSRVAGELGLPVPDSSGG